MSDAILIPTKIYLQIVGEDGELLDPKHDEITWCYERINEDDLEYELVPVEKVCPICSSPAVRRNGYCALHDDDYDDVHLKINWKEVE